MTGFYRFEGDLFTKNEKLSLQVVMVMKKKQDMQQPNKGWRIIRQPLLVAMVTCGVALN